LAALIYATFPGKPAQSTLTAAVSASIAPPPPAPSARLGAPIHLHLSGQPSTTRFVIDGVPAAANPYDGDFSNDGVNHTIAAQADGFDSREIQTRFDRDVFFDVTLPASAPVPAAASVAPPPAPVRWTRTSRPTSVLSARPVASSLPAQKAPHTASEEDDNDAKK
jgi:hypothetical protein